MIPRTTIDEANKHIVGLHKKVYELESLAKEQHEALLAKDVFLQEKLTEVSSAKANQIGLLQEKLESKERTVTILQEQMSQKNQQIAALQKTFKAFKKVISFKTDLTEFVTALGDAEHCYKGSMSLIDEPYFDDDRSAEDDSGIGTSFQYHHNGSSLAIDSEVRHTFSTPQSPAKQKRRNSKGREYYL